ncbi:MAG: hypothetical protein WC004_00015 [Candidatus Absconditabacterales bacterium]
MFLFDFDLLLDELRNHENQDKKEVIEKYEKNFGPVTGGVQDQTRYKEYVSNFDALEYAIPFASKEDFDWSLLCQLSAASFSSEVALDPSDEGVEYVISVENGGQTIAKKVSELFGYQIDRLFKIYCEEQMNLQNHIFENEQEKTEIMAQRDYKLRQWKLRLDHLKTRKEKETEQAERSDKLGNLMDQL